MRTILDILKRGLIEFGTRNEIQMQLIRYFEEEGFEEGETEENILAWYEAHDHKSKDWNINPRMVERELASAIANWYNKRKNGKRLPRAELTVKDIEFILETTARLTQNGRLGSQAYSVQRFLYSLLAFYKAIKKQVAPLPYNTVIQFDGVSKKTAHRRIEFAKNIGLLMQMSPYDRYAHKSRVMRLDYEFEDGFTVKSLEEGLAEIYQEWDLQHLYSRDIHARILRVLKGGELEIKKEN